MLYFIIKAKEPLGKGFYVDITAYQGNSGMTVLCKLLDSLDNYRFPEVPEGSL